METSLHSIPPGKMWQWESFSTVILTSRDDAPAQELFNGCLDFSMLTTGLPPAEDEGAKLFTDAPPGFPLEKKTVFGLLQEGRLVGVIDSIDGYPEQGIWFIGLFLLHPSIRGQGVGKAWLEAFLAFARSRDVRSVRLGVVEQNTRGRAFWASNGFIEIARRPPVRYGKIDNILLVMEKDLRQKS